MGQRRNRCPSGFPFHAGQENLLYVGLGLPPHCDKFINSVNPTAAPLSVNNFLKYVQDGFYANTLVHRFIAGFVIQGGGFTSGWVAQPGLLARSEFSAHLRRAPRLDSS